MSYIGVEMTDDGTVLAYPESEPYIMRDQSMRNADDMVRVVIGDVADVLAAAGLDVEKANALYAEACALWGDNETEFGWLDDETVPGAPEHLRDILQEAENLPHVMVEWNGDAGTVLITLADRWQEMTTYRARAMGIDV